MRDGGFVMKINTLGVVLSFYREKENLLPEQVCAGLCSCATLERIERGERIADSLLGKLLLERIGKEVEQFELLLNDEDYALWHTRGEMRESLRTQDYERLRRQVTEYRAMPKNYPNLHEQFCLYCETMMAAAEGESGEKICETAWQALQLTKTGIGNEKRKGHILYTQTEIELILLLIEDGYMDSADGAERELLKLLWYVENFHTERRKEETGVIIALKLFELAQNRGDEKKALEYIDKGISFISQGRGVKGLENLHFLKAQILAWKHDGRQGQPERKQAIQRECLMAYCICEVMGFTEKMKEIEIFCEEKLAWQITTLEM